jgi:hypothetical protein
MTGLTDFYDDLNDLKEVDWNVMTLRIWKDTNDDPDRKRRRQAEFLVYHFSISVWWKKSL